MKILSLYAQSNSLKFSLYEMKDEELIVDGEFERIGLDASFYTIRLDGEKIVQEVEINSLDDTIDILIDKLISLEVIKSVDDIAGIGHRVIQGRDKFTESVIVNDDVLAKLDEIDESTPINSPTNSLVIKKCRESMPLIPNVVVFDTAFNQTMDEETYLYPVPYKWYKEYGVRKFGFHGTSHRCNANTMKDIYGREDFKLISCHIGNTGSVAAIKDMKCVDTSMGFTDVSGIMMGTKSGDIDPSIIPYVMEKEGKNIGEILNDLNKNSGLLGLSEYSSDMRDINAKCDEGDEKALLARKKYVRRVVDYIAQYYVLLGGADALVFSAGVGENSVPVRREICEKLACLGVKIDLDKNNITREQVKISTEDSSIDVYVLHVDEQLLIARDTLNIIKNR